LCFFFRIFFRRFLISEGTRFPSWSFRSEQVPEVHPLGAVVLLQADGAQSKGLGPFCHGRDEPKHALVRAVLEGVAYGLKDSLEVLRALGCRLDAGRVSGGGARSELWLRIVASVLGLPLERTVVEEGAAYGAALLGGVAGGVFADVHEAVSACVRVRDTIEPDPGWQRVYEEGYNRYRALYPALRPLESQ